MTYLATQMIGEAFMSINGMWIFLAVGAIALFGIFLPVSVWMESRQKEREAYYRAETMRRISEAPGDGGNAAIQLLREQDRLKAIKAREGLKMGGVINIGVGVGLLIFLRALIGAGTPIYLCGLLPLFIGAAMIVYVYFMARPLE